MVCVVTHAGPPNEGGVESGEDGLVDGGRAEDGPFDGCLRFDGAGDLPDGEGAVLGGQK